MQDAGAVIHAYDPEGIEQAQKLLENVICCTDAYDAMETAGCTGHRPGMGPFLRARPQLG
ncbi:hypothetical protein [Sphingobium estronivorans]|uniref:hypothetical protein n=1 Tax=Sphingobium estronivorans TaxID=1577690 RepID=UPI001F083706|nr:hypothetical protein [Sphingobium estronivorans]